MDSSIALSVVLAALALATVPLARRLTGDYFPPGALVLGTWAATFSLFFLRVIPYAEITATTLLLVVASVTALVGLAHLSQGWFARQRTASVALVLPEVCLMVVALLGVAGTVWYVWSVADALGASVFFDRPWRIRAALSNRSVPSGYLALEYLCVAAPVLAVALALTGHRLRGASWFLVALCLFGTAISTDRTQFFVVVLTAYFMYVLSAGRRWSLIKLGLRTVTVLLILGSYFMLVGAWMGKTPANLNVSVRVPTLAVAARPLSGGGSGAAAPAPSTGWRLALQKRLSSVSTLYLYATASYAALDVLLDNPQPRTYGLQAAYPIARLLERIGLASGVPPAIAPFVPLGLTAGPDVSFNTYTFLYYPISDFGPVGAVAYAALIGLLSGFVYGRYRSDSSSTFWLLAMGHLSAALVLTVFVNKFNNTASWYIFLWSCLPFVMAKLLPQRVGA